MAQTTFSTDNTGKPAPKWFRKLKKALTILSDTTAIILLALGYAENSLIMLMCRIGLSGVLESCEALLANGEVYANGTDKPVVIIPVDALPSTGITGVWYHYNNNYWYWNGTNWVALYEPLGPGGGTNPPPTGLPPIN